MSNIESRFIQYGVSSELAKKAKDNGLTVSKCRNLSQKDIVTKFNIDKDEAKLLSQCVKRKAVDDDVIHELLERSNYVCSLCKGQKGKSYVIHHIEEYEKTQDNRYLNLIVLCPNDHDMAHQSGLSMRHSKSHLRKSKEKWEKEVERINVDRASKAIEVEDGAIDYVNIMRLEETCIEMFGEIPTTTRTKSLKSSGILNQSGNFDQKFVSTNLSNGRYLFDYINSGETDHYKQLLKNISDHTVFLDLDKNLTVKSIKNGNLEGQFAYFIGGVRAKGVRTPITIDTPSICMSYKRKNYRIEWVLDPMYLMSMSSITRIGGINRYIVYCLIRTIHHDESQNQWLIKATPLLIGQPTSYVHKTPPIAYKKKYEKYVDMGLIDADE